MACTQKNFVGIHNGICVYKTSVFVHFKIELSDKHTNSDLISYLQQTGGTDLACDISTNDNSISDLSVKTISVSESYNKKDELVARPFKDNSLINNNISPKDEPKKEQIVSIQFQVEAAKPRAGSGWTRSYIHSMVNYLETVFQVIFK